MTTLKSDDYDPPEPAPSDRAYAVVRTALGSVPLVGKAGVELLQYIVIPPLERRRTEWMNDIADGLRRLEAEKRVNVETLSDDAAFVDAVLAATTAAIRTSQRQKLAALRSAVLNSALPTKPDEISQQVFLAMVDRFTELHLLILKLFYHPLDWRTVGGGRLQNRRSGDAAQVLEEAFPELQAQRPLYEQLWLELHGAGLVRLNTLHNAGEGDGVMKKRTTPLGDAFVSFITSPLPE